MELFRTTKVVKFEDSDNPDNNNHIWYGYRQSYPYEYPIFTALVFDEDQIIYEGTQFDDQYRATAEAKYYAFNIYFFMARFEATKDIFGAPITPHSVKQGYSIHNEWSRHGTLHFKMVYRREKNLLYRGILKLEDVTIKTTEKLFTRREVAVFDIWRKGLGKPGSMTNDMADELIALDPKIAAKLKAKKSPQAA